MNTASPSLLNRVAGISSAIAKNIAVYREENGSFKSRSELKKVSKLGPKAFEQCAGFLRISNGKNVLIIQLFILNPMMRRRNCFKLCNVSDEDVKSGNISVLKEKNCCRGNSCACSSA